MIMHFKILFVLIPCNVVNACIILIPGKGQVQDSHGINYKAFMDAFLVFMPDFGSLPTIKWLCL